MVVPSHDHQNHISLMDAQIRYFDYLTYPRITQKFDPPKKKHEVWEPYGSGLVFRFQIDLLTCRIRS